MKGIEFALLAIGAVARAFVRYKMAESPLMLGTLSVNILVINVVGSFILGYSRLYFWLGISLES